MTERRDAPVIPGLTLVGHIGSGGFADVFLYEQRLPARKVAVKVIHAAESDEALAQFHAEANVMAQLSGHPAIVSIFAADVSVDGRPYIVMEYCPPPALAARFRTERIGLAETLEIGIRIASAVETVHRAGILHRDIKPHNILTSAFGAPKLTDFGIAGAAGDDSSYGMSVPWAPPESFGENPPADPRSDIYSLAATIYSLLAGRSPFEVPGGANDNATLMSRIERQPVARMTRAEVPESLNRLLAQALSKDADQRPATALDLARQLQDVQAEVGQAPTRVEVLDASPTAVPSPEEDQRTFIRPVQIIIPDGPADGGTSLRPRFVRPVADRTELRDRRPSSDATLARPAADVPPPPAPSQTEERVERFAAAPAEEVPEAGRGRRPVLLLGGAAAAAALVAVVVVAVVLGDGDDSEPPPSAFAGTDETPDAVADYVPPPTDLKLRVSPRGRFTFSWTSSDPRPGDTFGIQYDVANVAQAPANRSETSFSGSVDPGDIVCGQVMLVRTSGSASQPSARICEQAG